MDGTAKVSLILELKEKIKAGLNSAKKFVHSTVSDMKKELSSFKTSASNTLSGIADNIPGLSGMGAMLANPYVAATTAVLALGTAYYGMVMKAEDWEKSMAKANVTAQLTHKELDKLSGQLLVIGARNANPLSDVPEGFNRIISAGLDVRTSLATLEPVLKAAKAGFTDLETTAAATVSTMNSSGIMDANRVLDILFATLNKGNAEFADIAQYLPKIIPGARSAGFSLEEVAGSFAYLTAQGRSAEQSSTGLNNLFKQLVNPNVAKNLKEIGVRVFDNTGKTRSLLTIVKDLNKSLDGLSDQKRAARLARLGLDMESSGAISSMTQDILKLQDVLDFTTNSQGQLNEAVKNAQTPMDVWNILSNKVGVEMIKIGQTGLPLMQKIGQTLIDLIDGFHNLYDNSQLFRDTISGIGNVVSAAFTLATKGPMMLWNVFKGIGTVLDWISEKVLGTGNNFGSFYEKVRPYLMWVYNLFSQIASIAFKVSTFDFSGAWEGVKNFKLPGIEQLRQEGVDEIKRQKAKKDEEENPFAVAPGEGKPKKAPKLDNSPEAKSEGKISGGAKQIQNLTVKIDAFVKGGINTSNTQGLNNMSPQQIETWFNEMMMRTIRNLQTSYS